MGKSTKAHPISSSRPSPSRYSGDRFLIGTAAAIALAFMAAVYLPDLGRGFVKDDFGWIRDARAAIAEPARVLHPETPAFYRPLVTATFAIDYALHGLNARSYGFTNLALYLGCLLAIWLLLREAGVSAAAAAIGAFAWGLNPHGINMALVWISGRTSLLLTLCAAGSAWAFLRRRRVLGAMLLFAALLSKEEATILPFVLFAWMLLFRGEDRRAAALDAIALTMPLAAYAMLRTASPAMTPATAPWFYKPTTDVRHLAANALHYLDRAGTIFVVIAVMAWLVYRRPVFDAASRRALIAGIVWLAGGFALTIWIPVRSSLYAVFPSVGSALLCAAAVDASRRREAGRRDVWFAAALASVLAFIPVYRSRNDRWVEPARLSARVMQAVAANPPAPGAVGVVILEDELALHASFVDAFGSLASEAVQQATDRPIQAQVVPIGQPWAGPVAAKYKVTRGRVDRVQ